MSERVKRFLQGTKEHRADIRTALDSGQLEQLYSALAKWFRLVTQDGFPYQPDRFLAYNYVRVMSDFSAEGIWDDCNEPIQEAPSTLLSQELCDALAHWNCWYEEFAFYSFIRGSELHNLAHQEFELFDEVGRSLARQVKREAPFCRVYVFQESSMPHWLEVLLDNAYMSFRALGLDESPS